MSALRPTLAFGVVLLAASGAAAQSAPRIEPRADEVLKKMSAFLAAQRVFTVEAEETFDVVPRGHARRKLTNVRQVIVERPGRFASQATGDTLHRASWFDGRTLTVLDKGRNAYITVDAPATIDAVLDKVARELGIVLPLSDFFYADPYASLVDGITYGEYLGLHAVDGVPCHHLAFAQVDTEWQIWVDAGERPLPRKFAVAYVDEAGVPQYEARFRRWTLDPKLTAEAFRFVPPAGARKVEAEVFVVGGR